MMPYDRPIWIPRFGHRLPTIDGKPFLNSDRLREILHYIWAYDTTVLPRETLRLQLAGSYQVSCYTGAQPADLVDNKEEKIRDGPIKTLSGNTAVHSATPGRGQDDPSGALDPDRNVLDDFFLQEPAEHGQPKALCYEDIQMMIMRHPDTKRCIPAMTMKLTNHHRGGNNKAGPRTFHFIPSEQLLLCPILTIIALALHDQAFDAPSLTSADRIFNVEPLSFMQSIQLRWKRSVLNVPVFRRNHGAVLAHNEAMLDSESEHDVGQQSLDSGNEEPVIDSSIPERARLAKLLCHQPCHLTEDELDQLRIEVVGLMVDLCSKRKKVKPERI